MSKRSHDDRYRAGEQLLREWGVAAGATAEELGAFLGRAPATDLAIANRLGASPNTESVVLLQRLERESSDKEVRKEAKRALYRLRQRGMAVPEPPAQPAVPLLAPSIEGYLSAVDGRGDQLVWLVKPRADGVAHLFAVINDPAGLREVELNLTSRKALKHATDELAAKHEIRLVKADWRYCDFLMHRAFEWARARATPMTGDYPALRAQITREPPPRDLPPLAYARIDPGLVRADESLRARSVELLEEKELRTWFFGPEVVKPYLDEIAGARESPLLLNQMQQTDRVRAVVERAVSEIFAGEGRESYVRRLREMAYYFSATGRDANARQALAVALALEESSAGGRHIPFCEQLVAASIGAWQQVAAEREADRARSSLIVTPHQFAAERARKQR
jgi:hypothetical protein